jgi:uncharacterized lipoprotein
LSIKYLMAAVVCVAFTSCSSGTKVEKPANIPPPPKDEAAQEVTAPPLPPPPGEQLPGAQK